MYRHLRFPIRHLLATLVFALFSSSGFSVLVPVESSGYTPVAGGNEILSGTSLYVSSFDESAFSASNPTDVVIIEDMTFLMTDENDENNEDDDTRIIISNYTGYNTTSGETLDEGSLVFEVGVDDIFFANGVKGFYRKTGAWTPRSGGESFLLGDMSGTLSYDSLSKTRDVIWSFSGNDNGTPFQIGGDSTATVTTTDFVSIAGWDTSEESDYEFTFVSSFLRRDGNEYRGFLRRTDDNEPEEWQSLFAVIRLTDTNDSDGDGIPDLSDLGASEVLGVLAPNSISLNPNEYWSNDLNTVVVADTKNFWIHGENVGWFYLPDQSDPESIRIFISDNRLGWLKTNADISPYYVRESDGVTVYFDRIDGNVSFYDSELEAWFTVNYSK